jgi:hypothetical protein
MHSYSGRTANITAIGLFKNFLLAAYNGLLSVVSLQNVHEVDLDVFKEIQSSVGVINKIRRGSNSH